jgi:hypothetical protein
MKRLFLIGLAACLCATGCDDSKNPLSNPQTSKADERLIGVWLERADDGDVYYHVGHAGDKFPACVMRIVEVKHSKGKLEAPAEYLAFPTVIGDKTYLNFVLDGDKKLVKSLDEKGWKDVEVDCYTFLKYQIDGDKLLVWSIDEDAKQKAISSGKVRGVKEPDQPAKFTDTTKNVARFVKEAGDGLWDTKNAGRLERVNVGKKP